MKVVIKTDVVQYAGETPKSFKARQLKDVNNNYTLQANEAFSTDLEDIMWLPKVFTEEIVDYKRFRAGLKQYGDVDDTTWNTYSDDWKNKICKEKATDMGRIKAFFASKGDSINEIMKKFDRKSTKNRENRFSLAKSAILDNVEMADAFGIIATITADNLENNYIAHGMEGSESQDPVLGLYDFANSTSIVGMDAYGQPWNKYATTGLATRSMTLRSNSTHTQETLVALVNDYLKHGKKIT